MTYDIKRRYHCLNIRIRTYSKSWPIIYKNKFQILKNWNYFRFPPFLPFLRVTRRIIIRIRMITPTAIAATSSLPVVVFRSIPMAASFSASGSISGLHALRSPYPGMRTLQSGAFTLLQQAQICACFF